MVNRDQLQEYLESILGSENVYFQPPETTRIQYPAIVYFMDGIITTPADGVTYLKHKTYTITIIHREPEFEVVDKIADLPNCRHEQSYSADNLYHDVFSIYI